MSIKRIYTGRGGRAPGKVRELPAVQPEALRSPEGYVAPPDLAAAVDVALTLGMPLLLTGEPSSGKSVLADSVAYELGLGRALRFVVKSDTESRDLFYRFDTVGRFHATQTPGGESDPGRFITFEALGKAILHAKPWADVEESLQVPRHAVDHPGAPSRSVVLIDEIDKAPRDVPNDILVEIENMQFDIPELAGAERPDVRVRLDPDKNENQYRPIVVFTSNREKALPEPFLRRCCFYHLEFPPFEAEGDGAVTVAGIVGARLGSRYERDQSRAAERRKDLAIDFFRFLRGEGRGLERRPTLAELLDWLDYLMPQHEDPAEWRLLAALEPDAGAEADDPLLTSIETLLLKRPADQRRDGQRRAGVLLEEWRRAQGLGTGKP